MKYSVTIYPPGQVVDVPMGRTVLSAALDAGLDVPHSCQSGNCGACKARLVAGDFEMMPYSEYALTAEEREAGLILACRAMVWGDGKVVFEGHERTSPAPRDLIARIVEIADLTHDIREVVLDTGEGEALDFLPGQYARLGFADLPLRDFSMAGQPGERHLRFFIRRVPGGRLSERLFGGGIRPGQTVRVSGPYGSVCLRPGSSAPLLLAAGGSGLAPVWSILNAALAENPDRRIALYFGVRGEGDLFMVGELHERAARFANLSCTIALSGEEGKGPQDGYRHGMLHEVIGEDGADLHGWQAFLCGPPVMVDACRDVVLAGGVAAEECHADAFYTDAEKQQAQETGT